MIRSILMDESLKKSKYPSIDFDFDELSTIDDSAFDAIEDTLRNRMPRRRIITSHAQHRQMEHMHLLRTAHQHIANTRNKVHHNIIGNAIF